MRKRNVLTSTGCAGTRTQGVTLLEVLLGIVIFAVGMLALASLQTNLGRSSADANSRTVATNIAEEIIERARAFRSLDSIAGCTDCAYEDIVSGTRTEERDENFYTVQTAVTDYYFQTASRTFSTTKPVGLVYSDFKQVTINVIWNTSQEFQISETQTTAGRLGSGRVTISAVIPSIPALGSLLVASNPQNVVFNTPPAQYVPGPRPAVAAVDLGNNRFREAVLPTQELLRKEGRAETWFDVVTYKNVNGDATLLRRDEFVTVACQCKLRAPTIGVKNSRRPTVFDGFEYTEGELVSKPWGESATKLSLQSQYCDRCCRDHHDGGTGENDQAGDPGRALYDPFRPTGEYHTSGTFSGDHKHYFPDENGNLQVVTKAGDTYLEACRLVRRDGWFRVAQDFRQEALHAFPETYLATDASAEEYGEYLGDAATAFLTAVGTNDLYEASPPALIGPDQASPSVTFPASTLASPLVLPTAEGFNNQQLQARGIYMDYMTDDLRTVVTCLQGGGSAADCGAESALSAIELVPLFDVNLTKLGRWTENPQGTPVEVSNEPTAESGVYSRGLATLQAGGLGVSEVIATAEKRNRGITGTNAIDTIDASYIANAITYAGDNSGAAAAAPSTYEVSGALLSAGSLGIEIADVAIEGSSGVMCHMTNTSWSCSVQIGAVSPQVTFSGYSANIAGKACALSGTLFIAVQENSYTTFSLPSGQTSEQDVVFRTSNC